MARNKKPPSGIPPLDLRLWHHYTKDVKPLKTKPQDLLHEETFLTPNQLEVETKEGGPILKTPSLGPLNSLPLNPTARTSSNTLAYQSRKRLKRPKNFDARLDLHGMTQDHAYNALKQFIMQSASQGARNLLVITGKGSGQSADNPQTGVLRRRLPEWLEMHELRHLIYYYAPAHPQDGGAGAFQIRLRKQ